ncbi:MAG: PilZ domain-containing protein [Thermodesulfobacteriota bacterium]
MAKRRKFHRLLIPVPLTIRLLGIDKHPCPINVETRDVSREGLLIELEVRLTNGSLLIQEGEETIKLIPFLVLNEKLVELDIKIPPRGEKVRAIGRVRWYDFGSREKSYYFRTGIFMEEMEIEDRKRWEDFIKTVRGRKGRC